MEYSNFRDKVKNVKNKRKHKVHNSYGTKDAFFYYRKIRPKDSKYVLSDIEYLKIIRLVNNVLRDYLIAGDDVILPERMGRLEVKKRANKIDIKNGKVVTNKPVNWNETLKLWYEEPECFKNKTLVREEDNETFRIYYDKNKALYNNKSFYQFSANRQLKLGLKNNIKLNKIDAFTYGY